MSDRDDARPLAAGSTKSVGKAAAILEHLAEADSALGIRELAENLDMPKSTVQRLLETLEECRLTEQDSVTRRYRLGRQTFRLGMAYVRNINVRAVALPHMHALRRESGETVGLNIRVGHERMLVEQLESPSPIKFRAEVGHLYPLVIGAPGKILMSELPDEEIADLISAASTRGVKTSADLGLEVRAARSRGAAVAFQETIPELNTVAVPIRDAFGTVVAALGASGPSSRFGADVINELEPVIIRIGQTVSAELGFQERREA